jgi:hypothetical protein
VGGLHLADIAEGFFFVCFSRPSGVLASEALDFPSENPLPTPLDASPVFPTLEAPMGGLHLADINFLSTPTLQFHQRRA